VSILWVVGIIRFSIPLVKMTLNTHNRSSKNQQGVPTLIGTYKIANMDDLEGIAQCHAESWRNSLSRLIFFFQMLFLIMMLDERTKRFGLVVLSSPKKIKHIMSRQTMTKLYGLLICALVMNVASGTFYRQLHVSCAGKGYWQAVTLIWLQEWVD